MNVLRRLLVFLLVGIVVSIIAVRLLTPWMDRWGATDDEIRESYPGDELVQSPKRFVNHAVTVAAKPEQIFPWLLQMGADKGGLYSYTTIEKLIGCPLTNASRIHPEWQDLKVGDLVKMCPHDPAPPPYIVAQIIEPRALVLGHKENGKWVDLWQFVLTPTTDGRTRLLLRTRTMMVGGMWEVIHPVVFLMERGLLLGVKERAEQPKESP